MKVKYNKALDIVTLIFNEVPVEESDESQKGIMLIFFRSQDMVYKKKKITYCAIPSGIFAPMELPQWNCPNGIAPMELPQWNCPNGIASEKISVTYNS